MTMSASATFASSTASQTEQALFTFVEKIRCWYRRRRDLREARSAFMHTVYLEDRILDDMGVTRDEVLWAASLPLEQNAARALKARAAMRRAARAASRLKR